ncbi:MAG: hypothetical protein HY599_05110, partial [Candidatus Omnitrophica bacterium]|nr:hypothetical protein [Candidatus Omnitrophota bacterium]
MEYRHIGSIVVGVSVVLLVGNASAWAADADVAEAAEPLASDPAVAGPSLEQIRAAITAEADPELKAVMKEQLQLFESGELSANELGVGRDRQDYPSGAQASSGGLVPAGESSLAGQQPGPDLIGPPIEVGGSRRAGTNIEAELPPEARAELEKLFQEKGRGDPALDQDVREEAGQILEKYGIDPREFGPGPEEFEHEQGFDRAFEQMSPEAREQMERIYGGHEAEMPEVYREMMEREQNYEGMSQGHEVEAPLHEFEVMQHEYEAPQQEYEAPQYET